MLPSVGPAFHITVSRSGHHNHTLLDEVIEDHTIRTFRGGGDENNRLLTGSSETRVEFVCFASFWFCFVLFWFVLILSCFGLFWFCFVLVCFCFGLFWFGLFVYFFV